MRAKQRGHIIIGKCKGKRDVLFLTRASVPQIIDVQLRNGKVVKKSSTIVDYNGSKGYIDLSD